VELVFQGGGDQKPVPILKWWFAQPSKGLPGQWMAEIPHLAAFLDPLSDCPI
jgi:hypothetical protein